MGLEAAGRFGRSVHDDSCSVEGARCYLLSQVDADPVVHVRIVGPVRPADAPHAEPATRELAADGAAEEPRSARDHGEWGVRGCARRRDGHWISGAPDVCRELLVDGGDGSQVVDAERRAIACRHGGVKIAQ